MPFSCHRRRCPVIRRNPEGILTCTPCQFVVVMAAMAWPPLPCRCYPRPRKFQHLLCCVRPFASPCPPVLPRCRLDLCRCVRPLASPCRQFTPQLAAMPPRTMPPRPASLRRARPPPGAVSSHRRATSPFPVVPLRASATCMSFPCRMMPCHATSSVTSSLRRGTSSVPTIAVLHAGRPQLTCCGIL